MTPPLDVDAILALVDAARTDSGAAVRLLRDAPESVEVLAAEVRRLQRIERAAQAHATAVAKMDLPGYLSEGDTTDEEIAATDIVLRAALEGRP